MPSAPPHAPSSTPSVHEPPGRPWELELLISGAVVFALVQLPGWVDGMNAQLEPHLADTPLRLLRIGYMVAILVLYSLIACFVVHLAARAYWVGLVGLDAVFPNGVRWERTKYGPITRQVRQEQQPSLQALTDAADRFCSIIFSFAFASAAGLTFGMAVAAGMSLLTAGVSRLLFDGARYGEVFVVLYSALMIVLVTPAAIDRQWGHRLDPDGRVARWIRASLRAQYTFTLARAYVPIADVLGSNVKRWVMLTISGVSFLLVFGIFMVKMTSEDSGMAWAYDYLPDAGSPRMVEAVHYLDQRPRGRIWEEEPAIQSEVVRGPLVRLFLPYWPRRHDALIRERCPTVGPATEPAGAADEVARQDAVLRCLAALQPIRLDGRPVQLPLRFFNPGGSAARGMIAYLPTSGLEPGEHLLEIGAIPIPTTLLDPGERQPPAHFIPFWIAR